MFPVNHPLWEAWVIFCRKKNIILTDGVEWKIFLAGAKAAHETRGYTPGKIAIHNHDAKRLSESIDPI